MHRSGTNEQEIQMSYSIELVDENGCPVQVDLHTEGSNYVVGGSVFAKIDITYNYSWFFYKHIDADKGIRWLYGNPARECVGALNAAILALGTEVSGDYWDPTPGNAGHTLTVLRAWALQHPDATFRGD